MSSRRKCGLGVPPVAPSALVPADAIPICAAFVQEVGKTGMKEACAHLGRLATILFSPESVMMPDVLVSTAGAAAVGG